MTGSRKTHAAATHTLLPQSMCGLPLDRPEDQWQVTKAEDPMEATCRNCRRLWLRPAGRRLSGRGRRS